MNNQIFLHYETELFDLEEKCQEMIKKQCLLEVLLII